MTISEKYPKIMVVEEEKKEKGKGKQL